VSVDQVKTRLATCTVVEAKALRDGAADAVKWLRRRKANLGRAQVAAQGVLWVERWLGEWLAANVDHQGSRGLGRNSSQRNRGNTMLSLNQLGIAPMQSSRWQRAASLPEEELKNYIAACLAAGKIPTSQDVHKLAKQHKYQEDRRRAARRGRTVQLSDQARVLHGDFRTLLADAHLFPSASVPLFLSDPPYDGNSVQLYGDLAQHAARILQPGGSLITYCGKYALPQVLACMTPHLRYWWMLAVDQAGPSRRLHGRKVIDQWKPLLWFVKDHRGTTEYIPDRLRGVTPDKSLHHWAQAEAEAAYLIEHLTKPGDLVVDPLCGSGTTLVAALRKGRRALGIDIDAENVNITRSKLAAAAASRPQDKSRKRLGSGSELR
jgi:hypothetical protein